MPYQSSFKRMNEEYYSQENRTARSTIPKGDGLATAALVLGLIAALGCLFVLPPFIFGATAVVLGLLSAGEEGLSLKAKIGMFTGVLSMVILVVLVISAVYLLMTDPGLRENITNDFNRIYKEVNL